LVFKYFATFLAAKKLRPPTMPSAEPLAGRQKTAARRQSFEKI